MSARNIISLERMLGDRKLRLFVNLREDNRGASIELHRAAETVFFLNVPVDMVDTFEKAVAYFGAVVATLEAPASDFNQQVAA